MKDILEVKDLTKAYGGKPVVKVKNK